MSGANCFPIDASREDRLLTHPDSVGHRHRTLGPWGWGAAIAVIGAIDSWGSRYNLNPDAISYIEMARHAVAGAPDGLINGYWSPAYPVLLAPILAIAGHDWATAIPALHVVNFALYLVAAALFGWLLRVVSTRAANAAPQVAGLPGYLMAFGAAAYAIIAVKCIGLGLLTPDFGVLLAVLATACCCVQVERSPHSWRWAIALGVVLGAGYWMKGILLPLNAILLVALFAVPPRTERGRYKVATAALLFAVVALPLVLMVSGRVGRPTIGEVGRLNYAWEIGGVTPFTGWVGDSSGQFGVPTHPPRVLQAEPQTLEFATPMHATYALWFDPAYWYAGLRTYFDAPGQWRVLSQGMQDLAQIIDQLLVVLGVSVLALWFATARPVESSTRSRVWPVLGVWSAVAAIVYALVHVESRYLVGFVSLGVIRCDRRYRPTAAPPRISICNCVGCHRHLRLSGVEHRREHWRISAGISPRLRARWQRTSARGDRRR